MASPSGSPRRGRTLLLTGIPYNTHPSEVLELLQSLAGRLQRASTTRSSPSMSTSMSTVHSLAAQPYTQQPLHQRQHATTTLNLLEPASIPGCPSPSQPRLYSVKAEFSNREAAAKAHDLLITQPQSVSFSPSELAILPNFVLDEEDSLLDVPVIISSSSQVHQVHQAQPQPQPATATAATIGCDCGVCGTGDPSPRSEDDEEILHARRISADRIGIDPVART